MELYKYEGTTLRGTRPVPELARLLGRSDSLIEIAYGAQPAAVVIGVPHHAGPGVEWIAEHSSEGRRVADENAALYALVCLSALRERAVPSRLLIAAHATDHDPNKLPDSPYCERLLAGRGLRLVFECHAAGPDAPHSLELTAGRNRRAQPLRFARHLIRALGTGHRLAVQARHGSSAAIVFEPDGREQRGKLRYPALRTRSLVEAEGRGLSALHLEADPRFRTREDGGQALPTDGAHLGRALADSIAAYLNDATD
ncbi:MAG TPA: hypothetical protein VIY27_04590 [Myxococcota bacterium]